jgi:hypothetical protein
MEFLLIAFVLSMFLAMLILEANMEREFDAANAFYPQDEAEEKAHQIQYAKYIADLKKYNP